MLPKIVELETVIRIVVLNLQGNKALIYGQVILHCIYQIKCLRYNSFGLVIARPSQVCKTYVVNRDCYQNVKMNWTNAFD